MLASLSAAFPAKAGIQWVDYRLSERVWVPACAGNTDGERRSKALTQPSPTGRGLIDSSPRPLQGERVG